MAYKKYELKVIFTIDDSVESAVDDVKEMQTDLQAGLIQRQLLENDGYTNVKATLKEIS